ncbi:hypothetical protein F5050DRAFT_1794390 [Lentinula boryana]|uniref:Uncharacterized protein n=1 Tax=Lentinula boryana TaxID=40481 RepID=A0ABQ8PY85_9AGAR|nr:hypothetical protein F5050DRAFT_1794390 [Lentinula boryana]
MRSAAILLLIFTILAVLNPLVAVKIPKGIKNAFTYIKPKRQAVTSAASGHNKLTSAALKLNDARLAALERNQVTSAASQFEIEAYSDKDCESGYLGTLQGYVSVGRYELNLEAEGSCLKFVLPFTEKCSIEFELSKGHESAPPGSIQRLKGQFDAGGMMKGFFRSVAVDCDARIPSRA